MALFPRKKKNDDVRSQYRIRIHDGLAIQVQVGDEFPEVQLLDVSKGGTGLFVPDQDKDLFEEGRTVDLIFTPEGGARGIHTRAIIQSVETLETQFGSGARAGLQFTDQEALFEQLNTDLWTYFNRRTAYRIKQPKKETKLKFKYKSGTLDGWLVDISTRGFALMIDRGTSLLLLPGHSAEAKFHIPGTKTKAQTQFVAKTVYRSASANRIRIGFLFDQEESPDFTQNEDLISEYVMEKQRKELQGKGE